MSIYTRDDYGLVGEIEREFRVATVSHGIGIIRGNPGRSLMCIGTSV